MDKKMYSVILGTATSRKFDDFLEEYFEEDEIEYTVSNPDAYYGKDYGRRQYVLWAEEIPISVVRAFLEKREYELNYCGALECLG